MEYTKSEVRKLKKLIDEDILKLEHYTKLYIPDPLTGLGDLCIADFAVSELDAHLKCIKEYIENTDNYNLAVEIEGRFTPVWGKYVEKVTNEVEIKRLGTMPGHLHFSSIRDTMLDWLDWLDEYEAEHPQQQQDTPTNSPSTKEETKSRTIKESELCKHFNAKFKGAGNNPNLFNNLIADLKDLTTTSDCSAVALMIWESNTGFINSFSTFAKWCRFFFDCIGVEVKPKYNYSRKVQATNKLKKKFYYL